MKLVTDENSKELLIDDIVSVLRNEFGIAIASAMCALYKRELTDREILDTGVIEYLKQFKGLNSYKIGVLVRQHYDNNLK